MRLIRLTPSHAAEYRAVMLRSYAEAPEAFTSTVAEREALPLEWWSGRLSEGSDASQRVFGAFLGDSLVGVAGLACNDRPKTRHKALLFGMSVLQEARSQGVGRSLVEAVLSHARSVSGLRLVQLTVSEGNGPARELYESCGFRSFGTEPMALQEARAFVAKVHMWCDLESPTRNG